MVTVKMAKLPGESKEYLFEDGTTLAKALATAGLDSTGYQVRVSGTLVEGAFDELEVEDGDSVMLVKPIKGAQDYIEVKIAKLPGELKAFCLNGDRKVRTLIATAGLTLGTCKIRINGLEGDIDDELEDGDTVVLVSNIKGA